MIKNMNALNPILISSNILRWIIRSQYFFEDKRLKILKEVFILGGI